MNLLDRIRCNIIKNVFVHIINVNVNIISIYFKYICLVKKKITIKDIARLADVSIGTVDRVIHNRGKVSQKAHDRVHQVMEELQYKPNPLARILKNNTVFRIQILIPDPSLDPYWTSCSEGIGEIIQEFEAFDIDFNVHYFDPSLPEQFLNKGYEVMVNSPDALLFVPLFETESTTLLKELKDRDIVTGTFNSPLNNEMGQHVGQDLFVSGRVAAKLMSILIPESASILIVHIDESHNAIHIKQKEEGFRSFFREKRPYQKLTALSLRSNEVHSRLASFIKESEPSGFFVTTSKTYQVAEVLELEEWNSALIGYDLIERNIDYLKKDRINFLIHQAPKQQASLSLRYIIESLLFDKKFPNSQLLPIDIINSENVNSYL